MRKCSGLSILLAVLVGGLSARGANEPMPEVVVAMRYLQQTGRSHAHLYLYREDGKLLRQLTDNNTGQDRDPVFSPDGKTIVFARAGDTDKTREYWSIEPRGGNLHKLPAAPDWYAQARTPPAFDHLPEEAPGTPEAGPFPRDPRAFTTPDGTITIKLIEQDNEERTIPNQWDVHLRTTADGKEIKVGNLVGYSASFLSSNKGEPRQCVLEEGKLKVTFCYVHLNSTDGDSVYALDLQAKRLVRLSPNWAEPYPLPGEPAFLTWTENRYLPYGDGQHTANCSYLEHWDAKLTPVRYAKGKAPGELYGASMYRPGRVPTVMAFHTDEP